MVAINFAGSAIELVLVVAAVAVLAPSLILLFQVMASFLPRAREGPDTDPHAEGQRVAVLVPAHNEESGIGRTIDNVREQLAPWDRLIVVADNCTDRTVEAAGAHSAEVVERHDSARVGKGYALAAGYRHLAATGGCETVVILDADCVLAPGALDRLRQACRREGRPQQALYLMQCPAPANLKGRVAEFAWMIKNWARPLGYARLGLPCQLMGSGMAFPYSLLSEDKLATGHIVEDLVLGAELALGGTAPRFCDDAVVFSEFPVSESGREGQRTRWVHGQLLAVRGFAPALLREGIMRGNLAALALGADLFVPPLAVLLTSGIAGLAVATAWYFASGSITPLALNGAAVIAGGLALIAAWLGYGRHLLRPYEFLLLPAYLPAIARIIAKFLVGRRAAWQRSERMRRR